MLKMSGEDTGGLARMKQSFKLIGQHYEVQIHFYTEDVNMGEAFQIEANRIVKCIGDGHSFMESKNRLIHEKQSKPCTVSGALI
jgi:hypothetical protein